MLPLHRAQSHQQVDKPADKLVIGRCGRPYGVRGWIHIHTYTQSPKNFLRYTDCYLLENNVWRPKQMTASRLHGTGVVVKFHGCEDRDAAERLTHAMIAIDPETLPPPEHDEYYWYHLIGLTVINQEGIVLGQVTSLMETGAHDVLVLDGDQERLIPFTAPIVIEVDLKKQQLIVDWQPDY